MDTKPGKVTAIAICTLVSGVFNVIGGLGLTISVVLGTLGIGLLCAPVTLLPTLLGIFEIIYGAKLLATDPQPMRPSQAIAILEIVTIFYLNVISVVIGIVALVFYNDPEVKAYFAEIAPAE